MVVHRLVVSQDDSGSALFLQLKVMKHRLKYLSYSIRVGLVVSCLQYQEEIDSLNQVARHRPRSSLVLGIQQENRQIRELQQENKGR